MATTLVNMRPVLRSLPTPVEPSVKPTDAEHAAPAPEVYWGDRLAVYVWMASAGILAVLLGLVTVTDLLRT